MPDEKDRTLRARGAFRQSLGDRQCGHCPRSVVVGAVEDLVAFGVPVHSDVIVMGADRDEFFFRMGSAPSITPTTFCVIASSTFALTLKLACLPALRSKPPPGAPSLACFLTVS